LNSWDQPRKCLGGTADKQGSKDNGATHDDDGQEKPEKHQIINAASVVSDESAL
jgi:hypothetical protein